MHRVANHATEGGKMRIHPSAASLDPDDVASCIEHHVSKFLREAKRGHYVSSQSTVGTSSVAARKGRFLILSHRADLVANELLDGPLSWT